MDLTGEDPEQGLLFAETPGDTERSNRLMNALDKINRSRGRGTVRYAGEGLGDRWRMRQGRLSEASTTEWAGLQAARASLRGATCRPGGYSPDVLKGRKSR